MVHAVTRTPELGRIRVAQAVDTEEAAQERTLAVRLPLVGLLAIQVFIGYEWFISGITKIVRGGFPAGLADELTDKSQGAPGVGRRR